MRNSAYIGLLLIFALAGCGSPASVQQPIPVPPPPAPLAAPDPIDIAKYLFSTQGRNVGPAFIFDASVNNELIRVAYAPDGKTETHSVYGVDVARGCIAVKREESWNRPPTVMWALQTYTAAPCWINRLYITPGQEPIVTTIIDSPWTWSHFDPVTGVKLDGDARGTFSDRTTLTADFVSAHLTEGYWDTSLGVAGDPYCVRGDYDKLGLGKLTPATICVQP